MLPETRRKLEAARVKAVAKAELRDGYREGTYRRARDTALYRVELVFYPKRKWYISTVDLRTGALSQRKPLTRDIWDDLRPALKLHDD